MGFTVIKKMSVYESIPDLCLEVPNGEKEVEITYEITNIISLSPKAKAEYTISVQEVTSGAIQSLEFTYDGQGNPYTQAEDALKALVS